MAHQMTVQELYEGLPKEFAGEYRDEAQKRWSEAVKRSEDSLRTMTKADFTALKEEFKQNWQTLATMTAQDPTSDAVQERILRHYTLTRKFWGTSTFADKQAIQFKALGEMYTEDPRFTVIDGKPNPEFAAFMAQAMAHFADTALDS